MKKSAATPDKFPHNRRIPVVDLVRLASVFLIVGYHFFSSGISPTGYSPKTLHWIITLFPNGYYGVTFFFVISGFIITRILAGAQDDFSKVDLKSFYVKRAARIFPLFALTILTAWGMLTLDPEGPGAAYCLKAIGESFRWDFWLFLGTFQFNWFIIKESHLRPVALHWNILWTLAVEEQFYFFYPLIVKYLKTGAKILIFLGGVVFLGIVYRMAVLWCFPGNFTWGYISSFANFDQIAVGGVLFFVYEKLKKTKNVSPSFPTLCLALGMVFNGLCLFFHFQPPVRPGLGTNPNGGGLRLRAFGRASDSLFQLELLAFHFLARQTDLRLLPLAGDRLVFMVALAGPNWALVRLCFLPFGSRGDSLWFLFYI